MINLNQKIEKTYFSIGEVADILELKPYVLRYWESEFEEIKPMKNSGGIRRYKKEDIEILLKIKKLLHEKRFTVAGARNFLKNEDKIMSYNKDFLNLSYQSDELRAIRDQIEKLITTIDNT